MTAGFATLPPDEASRVVSKHPELSDVDFPEQLLVVLSVRDSREAADLADLFTVARGALASHRRSTSEVLRALLPEDRLTVSPGVLAQLRRNAVAQAALADEFGLLSSAEVAALAGSKARNPAALASRWRKEGRLFAVEVEGASRYPGFQFDGQGRPLPIIGAVLEAFGGRLSGWEIALWFTGDNDWLGAVRPVDALGTDADQVREVAQRLADELVA